MIFFSNRHGELPLLIMKLAMPVSPSPTLPRWERAQTNRYASFTLAARLEKVTGCPT